MADFRNLLRNKRLWLITIAVFALLLLIFDRNNLLNRHQLKERIRELEAQKAYYERKIAEDSTLIEQLKNDAFLEQYARERYLMKRPGEALYVFPE